MKLIKTNILITITVALIVSVVGCDNSVGKKEQLTGYAAVITSNTELKESSSENSKTVSNLEKGNLIKVISKNPSWSYVELVCFSVPGSKGYITTNTFSTDLKTTLPNQGFTAGFLKAYEKPDATSKIIGENDGPVHIKERRSGWAYCSFVAGQLDGWIRESDIKYEFP